MIKVEQLKRLLNIKEKDLKNLDMEQLRLMLGIFRYLSRILDREINTRQSSGNVK